eukprot:s85_g6.t1
MRNAGLQERFGEGGPQTHTHEPVATRAPFRLKTRCCQSPSPQWWLGVAPAALPLALILPVLAVYGGCWACLRSPLWGPAHHVHYKLKVLIVLVSILGTMARLDVDRYGVPQYPGDPELYDEYEERAWDLWHGREGQDSMQTATAVHLRAGLSGTAYEAVRKLDHGKIKTKDAEGKPTDAGLKFFLKTLKDSIASVKPVKANELFLQAFYSPNVWRRPQETMQQYIIRREQDFRRLTEVSSETAVSQDLRAMMLLIFGGLDQKEQVSVLSSLNNIYDFDKISNAMRIQYPQVSGKLVHRRDYLGCARGGGAPRDSGILFRSEKPKYRSLGKGRGRPHHAFTTDEAYDQEYDESYAGYDDDAGDYEHEETYEAYEAPMYDGAESFYEDDMDAFLQNFPDLNPEEDEEVADALATVLQYKKKGKGKSKGQGPASSQSVPFKASGDISFDAKAKQARGDAVKFLKSVTTCTSCHQKGHWYGDDACPNSKKRGGKSASPKKKPTGSHSSGAKKTTFFVLHDKLEPDDEAGATCFTFAASENAIVSENLDMTENAQVPVFSAVSVNDLVHVSNAAHVSNEISENAQAFENVRMIEDEHVPAYDLNPDGSLDSKPNAIRSAPEAPSGHFVNSENEKTLAERNGNFGACFTSSLPSSTHEVLMVLKDTQLCAHSSYYGGNEREYHRGANGHTRHIVCKDSECNKTVISAKRKDPGQLWRYLVQVALCTLWGRAARSRELFASVCRVREKALQDQQDRSALRPPQGYPGVAPHSSPGSSPSRSSPPRSSTTDWELCGRRGSDEPRTAKIIRPVPQGDPGDPRFWAYGVLITPGVDLPDFPLLASDDQDILQPLPGDNTPCGPETPYEGYTFCQVASSPEAAVYCHHTLLMVLENKPVVPEIYRLAFYLYGRAKLLHSAITRMWKAGEFRPLKRPSSPDEMLAQRSIRVPLCFDIHFPEAVQVHDFEVMMVGDDPNPGDRLGFETYASDDSDPPGLAILDSGCTRTMPGTEWSDLFEAELAKIGLSSRKRLKKQSFRGVGGQIASDTVKIFPIGINKVNGELHSAEAPGGLPLLLSRPFMEELQTVIDIGSRTVSFNKIGVTGLPLIRTKKGHLAVSLLDFDFTALDDYESPHPSDPSEEALAMTNFDMYEHCMVHGFDGQCPDDVLDAQIELDFLRDEVEGMRCAGLLPPSPPLEHQDPLLQGEVCEDVNFVTDNLDQFVVRKATTKKTKKFSSWQSALHGEDWQRRQVLSGNFNKFPHRPPYGKTWLKQLFAGQMGLTMLAILAGLSVGTPLDSSSSSWDASTSQGYKHVCHDLLCEDPFLTVITQPCGPWGNWSRFNLAKGGQAALTVLELRAQGRSILKLVAKVIVGRVKAKRHVFIEQPVGSSWLEEEELAEVVELISDGILIQIRVDGCQVG